MKKILFLLSLSVLFFVGCSNLFSFKHLDDPDKIAYEDYFVLRHPASFYQHFERVEAINDPTPKDGTGIVGTWLSGNEYRTYSSDGTYISVTEYQNGDYSKDTHKYALKKDSNGHFKVVYIRDKDHKSESYYMILNNRLYHP